MAVYIESSFGQWKLPLGSSHLGRGVDCAIRLDDLRLSRHHAELIFDGSSLQVKDLGSMNGVLVNGDRISDLHHLEDGAQMTLGPFSFSVRFAEDEKDPSRVASEAMAQQQAAPPKRKPSNDFSPSTDRSRKKTIEEIDALAPAAADAPPSPEPQLLQINHRWPSLSAKPTVPVIAVSRHPSKKP